MVDANFNPSLWRPTGNPANVIGKIKALRSGMKRSLKSLK
jgi:hypothetical protein